VSNPPTPLLAGTGQSKTVSGLQDDTTYCFSLRAFDEVGNASFSNNASGTTDSNGGGFW
jgi:chitodextrinase